VPRHNLELVAIVITIISHGSTSSGGHVHLGHNLGGCNSRLCLRGGCLYSQLSHGRGGASICRTYCGVRLRSRILATMDHIHHWVLGATASDRTTASGALQHHHHA
jgi:hypothetical protein